MISASELLKYDLDIVPKFLILKELLRLSRENIDYQIAKKELLKCKLVYKITEL